MLDHMRLKPANRERPDPMKEPTLTVERAADVLGISRGHIYTLIRNGDPSIPALKIGGRYVVPTGRLLALIDGKEAA